MSVLHGPGKVHHGQQGEDKGLHDAGEDRQEHHGQGSQELPRQEQEDGQDQIFTHDIAEKTQCQGEHPGEVADESQWGRTGAPGPGWVPGSA